MVKRFNKEDEDFIINYAKMKVKEFAKVCKKELVVYLKCEKGIVNKFDKKIDEIVDKIK